MSNRINPKHFKTYFNHQMDVDLIELVKNRPPLYQVDSEDYKNRKLREYLWQEISDELRKDVEVCKTRWRSIRDTYKKNKNLINMVGVTKSKYNTERLSFLDENLKFSSWVPMHYKNPQHIDDSSELYTVICETSNLNEETIDEENVECETTVITINSDMSDCDEAMSGHEENNKPKNDKENSPESHESKEENSPERPESEEENYPERPESEDEYSPDSPESEDEDSHESPKILFRRQSPRKCVVKKEDQRESEKKSKMNVRSKMDSEKQNPYAKLYQNRKRTVIKMNSKSPEVSTPELEQTPMKRNKPFCIKKIQSNENMKESTDAVRIPNDVSREEHPIEIFFKSMARTVMGFPPQLIATTRMKVCQIVSEMEIKALSE